MKKTIAILLLATILVACDKTGSDYKDGLPRSTPEQEGVHSSGIRQFVEAAEDQGISLHSFMVMRHGKVISEGYWAPYTDSIPHPLYSVTKTFTSTAIGLAYDEGLLSTNDKVTSLLDDELLPANVSDDLEALTIHELLTMTAGQNPEPRIRENSNEWVKEYLATPIKDTPGSRFLYNSYASHILSAIIEREKGLSVDLYLHEKLFRKMGIVGTKFEIDPQGVTVGGWGMRVLTSDMAKLGQLYLQKGKWNGEQLLSEEWIEKATMPHIYQRPDRTTQENAKDDWAQGYCYQMWKCTHNAFRADGAYGQFIVVMPDQDMVVVMTAFVYDMQKELNLVWDNILPAITNDELPSNDLEYSRLKSKVANLSLPLIFESNSAIPEVTESRTYEFVENERGIKRITIDANKVDQCSVTIDNDKESHTLILGIDSWIYNTMPAAYFSPLAPLPRGINSSIVSGIAHWETGNKLQTRHFSLSDMRYEDFTYTFEGDILQVSFKNCIEEDHISLSFEGQLVK